MGQAHVRVDQLLLKLNYHVWMVAYIPVKCKDIETTSYIVCAQNDATI